jgi:hypothetical protein
VSSVPCEDEDDDGFGLSAKLAYALRPTDFFCAFFEHTSYMVFKGLFCIAL